MAEAVPSEIEYLDPNSLEPHPLNDDVYGDRTDPDEALLASIEDLGVLEPIVADPQPEAGETTDQPTIISGHRRTEVAKKLELEQVPVRFRHFETDLERREKLLAYNQQRDKSFSQQLREAEAVERIERERAKQRQGARTDIVENSARGDEARPASDDDFGKTRDKVADAVGFGSGRTYGMAKTVWDAAQEGDTVAQHEVDKLDREEQSVYGAYQKVRDRIQPNSASADEDATASSDEEEQESPSEGKDPERVAAEDAVLSAHTGTNDDVFPEVLDLHVEPGSEIADITYGEGVFWRQVPSGEYQLTATDIDPSRSPDSTDGVDCRDLPYDDASFDCVVLDPPYAEGFYGSPDKPSDNDYWIKDRYVGETGDQSATYHDAVLEMYAAAGEEARRILRDDGLLIAKMQDEVSRNEQRLTHIEVTNVYEELGFHAKDLFVVVRPDTPAVGRMYDQRRARKNHSYFLVYEKRTDA